MIPREFLTQFPKHSEFSRNSKVVLFAYYLRTFRGEAEFKASQIRECFRDSLLREPSDLSKLLKQLSSGRSSPLIKGRQKGTYALSINGLNEVESILPPRGGTSPSSTSFAEAALSHLQRTLAKVNDENRKKFLAEAISCLGVDARRATVVMTWLVAMDHLYEYVLTHKLTDFNTALHNRSGRESQLTIQVRDDFTELKESIFIEVCRSARIISNDVRKILDEKLGFRNSCAHPSSVSVGEAKVVTFVEDLVDNILAKYAI